MINYVIIPSPEPMVGTREITYSEGGMIASYCTNLMVNGLVLLGKSKLVFSWYFHGQSLTVHTCLYNKIVVGCWFCCDVPLKLQKNSRIVHYPSSWLKMLLPPNRADRVRVLGPVS